jgi:hypothetical protein
MMVMAIAFFNRSGAQTIRKSALAMPEIIWSCIMQGQDMAAHIVIPSLTAHMCHQQDSWLLDIWPPSQAKI